MDSDQPSNIKKASVRRTSKAMPPKRAAHGAGKPAMQWLSGEQSTGGVMHQVQTLIALQKEVDAWAAERHLRLQVASYQSAKLRLLTSHPAMLARIRQQTPSLLQQLQLKGWAVEAIEPKVQSRAVESQTVHYPKKAVMNDKAKQEWLALKNAISDESLKAATAKLCKHHGWGN